MLDTMDSLNFIYMLLYIEEVKADRPYFMTLYSRRFWSIRMKEKLSNLKFVLSCAIAFSS